MRKRSLLIPAVLIVGLSPVVTWWVVGDLSEDVISPDYFISPPNLAGSTENAIGAAASVVVGLAVGLLIVAYARRLVTSLELQALVPLLAIGVYFGFTFRVLTAGVVGANIGAGILLMAGLFFVPVMLLIARRLRAANAGRLEPN